MNDPLHLFQRAHVNGIEFSFNGLIKKMGYTYLNRNLNGTGRFLVLSTAEATNLVLSFFVVTAVSYEQASQLPKNLAFLNKPIYVFTKAAIDFIEEETLAQCFAVNFAISFRVDFFAYYLWATPSLFTFNNNVSKLPALHITYIELT